MDMHFKRLGKKLLAERKPWQPDTKLFDYWEKKVAAERRERFLELKQAIAGYIYDLRDIGTTEPGERLPLPEKIRTGIAMLKLVEIEELRSYLILKINKDFVDFVNRLESFGLAVRISSRTFYCIESSWFFEEDLRKLSQYEKLNAEQYEEMKKKLKSAEGVEGKIDEMASDGRHLTGIKQALRDWSWYLRKHCSLASEMAGYDPDEERQDGHYYVGWLGHNFGYTLGNVDVWVYKKMKQADQIGSS